METKQCSDCGEVKTLDLFTKNAGSKQGVYSMCKVCRSRRRTADPEKTLRSTLKYSYGISLERYYEVLDSQGGRCYICWTMEPGGRGYWHIDHDHRCCEGNRTCGKCIRGILCVRCNLQVGQVESLVLKFGNSIRNVTQYLDRRAP